MFDSAFSNDSNSQDDIDENFELFIYTVKSLKDTNHVIVSRTVEMIEHILKKEGGRERVVNTPQMVAALVDVLNSSNEPETITSISKILFNLSECQPGLLSIYQSNVIPTFIGLLSDPVEYILSLAVITLHNLLLNQEGSKAAVCDAGGLQKIMILLKYKNEKVLSIVIDCLFILAYRNQENKLLILSSDGPAELVRIMSTCSFKTLLFTTSRVLKVLSVCSSNKRAIIASGGMQALGKHLNNSSKKLVLTCLQTLQNLSDSLNTQKNASSILKILVQLLRSSDKNIVTCTVGILSNMTCNNHINKVIVCQERGISALLKAMAESVNSDEIIESAIRTLRHLTCRHPEAETAQNAVRLHSGLHLIVKILCHHTNWSLIKAAIGLVRNLTLCPNNHEPLTELGTVHILNNILHFVYQDFTKNGGYSSCYETQPTVIEGVKMEDILEGTLSALLNLARNVRARELMKDHNIINTFVQILHKEKENIQCIVSGLFCEIASDQDGILIAESAGAVPFLCRSLLSKNQCLASQSGFLLIQLSALKPKEYTFLLKDLNKVMRNNDSVPWHELLKSSPSVTPEFDYVEGQGSFICPESRSSSNQGFCLQPMKNPSIQESEDLSMKMELDIHTDLSFDSTFDDLQLGLLSFSPNEVAISQNSFNFESFD